MEIEKQNEMIPKKKNNNNLAPLVYQAEDESCIYTEVKVGAEGAERAY